MDNNIQDAIAKGLITIQPDWVERAIGQCPKKVSLPLANSCRWQLRPIDIKLNTRIDLRGKVEVNLN